MLCSKCGNPIEPGNKSCPHCNEKNKSTQKLHDTHHHEGENHGKNAPAWFKLFLVVVILGSIAIGYHFFSPSESLTSLAQAQLAAIRSHNIDKAYYNYTSKEYQTIHSLNYFKELVNTHPALYENKNANFYDQNIENQSGTLAGTLIAQDNSTAPVIYGFEKEEDGWKIADLQIYESGAIRSSSSSSDIAATSAPRSTPASTPAKTPAKTFNSPSKPNADVISKVTAELKEPVEGQLRALEQGDIQKAYDDYVSKEFKQATPMDAFTDFIKSYPELSKHTSVTYGKGIVENGQGKISALISTDQQSIPIEYVLVRENNAWKIWGFRMLNATPPTEDDTSTPAPQSSEKTPTELTEIIQKNLKSLKDGEIQKTYDEDISTEFKQATSLDAYKNFIKDYPEMTGYQTFKMDEPTQEDDLWVVPVTLTSDKGESKIEFRLAKEADLWKIYGISFVSSASHPKIDENEKKAISPIIEEELEALRKNDLSKAYYAFVSKDFEKATSFEAFKDFIKSYPIFLNNTKDVIEEGYIDGDIRIVRASLQGDKENYLADFQFTKDGDKWKIWGIKIYTDPNKLDIPQDKDKVTEVIKSQLDAIKSNDISKAYYAYSSDNFKEVSNENDFKKFIENHSVIGKNKSFDIQNISFDRNIATAVANLTSDDNTSKSVEYRMIYSDGDWKILSIQMYHPPTEEKDKSSDSSDKGASGNIEFTKAVIGTKVDLKGLVTDPATTFKSDKSELTANIYVTNGTSGESVEVVLEHLDTKSSVPAVKVNLEKNGDSVVNFVFTPPTQGWPTGNYQLHVKSSTGVEKTFDFKVE